MADQDQEQITGTVQHVRVLRGDWGAVEVDAGDGLVYANGDQHAKVTGDVKHLSRGDAVTALGSWRTTRWGTEFRARAILQDALLPALREIEAVTDRFLPRRPSRGAVLGLVIRLGSDAAATMARDPFLPVVSDEHAVRGWGYGSARQYADLVGIPQDDPRRATAAVADIWPQLADGSVVVSRGRLEKRIALAAGLDATTASAWVARVIEDGKLEFHGPREVCWRADAQAERAIAKLIKERAA